MSKKLVAYFSPTGTTAKLAKTLAEAAGADLFEIKPETPYTRADLNWMDKKARSTVEMNDPASRPAIGEKCGAMAEYDTVFVGFPIWWYVAPTIISFHKHFTRRSCGPAGEILLFNKFAYIAHLAIQKDAQSVDSIGGNAVALLDGIIRCA